MTYGTTTYQERSVFFIFIFLCPPLPLWGLPPGSGALQAGSEALAADSEALLGSSDALPGPC